ncbi:MAG: hypothetical protein M1820_001264 [Bogoriella megaspora]|nr:MAG: hypothetical protein M1820_001264 [Bogoriella megaspora]
MAHHQTTFLTLPREIRDQIYNLSLTPDEPITVWSGEWKVDAPILGYEQQPWRWMIGERPGEIGCPLKSFRAVEKEATIRSLENIAFNILLSNATVAVESAPIFYQNNTFEFLGEHNWDPIVSWLEAIGRHKRGFLTAIQIEVVRPDRVWQLSDGRRISCLYTKEEVYPRNRWLRNINTRPLDVGIVPNINPAIERIFSLLGDRNAPQTTSLTIRVLDGDVPGEYNDNWGQSPLPPWTSLDLPNLIEKFRVVYTANSSSCAPLDICWTGETVLIRFQDIFVRGTPNLRYSGWYLQSLSSYDCTVAYIDFENKEYDETIAVRKVKRQDSCTGIDPTEGPYASEPCRTDLMTHLRNDSCIWIPNNMNRVRYGSRYPWRRAKRSKYILRYEWSEPDQLLD